MGLLLQNGVDRAAFIGANLVIHCAYAIRETDRDDARRVNEDGTAQMLPVD